MVVLFQGTHNDNHSVANVAAACSVLAAKTKNRKTLAIQLTSAGQTEIEDLLIGKKKMENRITDEMMGSTGVFRISDRGIDALQRRSESQKLVKEHFNSSCEAVLEDNLLDIATVTEKEDFIETLTVSSIENIIQHAKKVYDCIFILVEGKNKDIMADMLSVADIVVTCVTQNGIKETYNKPKEKEVKEVLVLSDYENTSIYNAGYEKNIYGVKKIYKVSHNVRFKDACTTGVLKDFIMENADSSSKDELYDFFKELNVIVEQLFDKVKFEDAEKELNRLTVEEEKEEAPLNSFENVEVVEKEVEKGLFRRKKKVKQVVVTQNTPNDLDFIEDEFEEEASENTETPVEETVVEETSVEATDKPKAHTSFRQIVDEVAEALTSDEEDEDEVLEDETPDVEPQPEVQKPFASKNMRPMVEPKDKAFFKKKKMQKKEKHPFINQETPPVDTTPQKTSPDEWTCECGAVNTGKFCMDCGQIKPEKKADEWTCRCGAVNTGKFCMECGKPRAVKWFCPECGTENTSKFCMNCGYKK